MRKHLLIKFSIEGGKMFGNQFNWFGLVFVWPENFFFCFLAGIFAVFCKDKRCKSRVFGMGRIYIFDYQFSKQNFQFSSIKIFLGASKKVIFENSAILQTFEGFLQTFCRFLRTFEGFYRHLKGFYRNFKILTNFNNEIAKKNLDFHKTSLGLRRHLYSFVHSKSGRPFWMTPMQNKA